MILQEPFPITIKKTYTRTLTIDHTQVPSTQTNIPILVNFTDATFKTNANGGHVVTTNAFTFSSDSGGSSLLKWEVERYNASTGEIVAWVKIASVSSSVDTVFYLRYGSAVTTDQSDPTNVWTNSFVVVYHLKDGTTLDVSDSRATNNATNHGATATSGVIDGAASLASASSQYVNNGESANKPPPAVTLSAWINATSFPNSYNTVLGYDENTGGVKQAMIWVKSNGKMTFFVQGSGSIGYDGTGSNTLSSGTSYYVALTYNSTAGLVGYVNASSDGTAAANGALVGASRALYIGNDQQTAGRFWNGVIDECRVADVARSNDWLTVEYNNQKPSANMVALGSET